MQMTATEITKGLTQKEYERLLNNLAGAIQTQRRFITILSAEQKMATVTRYTVKRQGSYYPYVVEEIFTCCGKIYLNLGLLI